MTPRNGMPARHRKNAEDVSKFLNPIGPVCWLVVPILALADRFDVRSRIGASRLEEDKIRKQAWSASCTPPPRK